MGMSGRPQPGLTGSFGNPFRNIRNYSDQFQQPEVRKFEQAPPPNTVFGGAQPQPQPDNSFGQAQPVIPNMPHASSPFGGGDLSPGSEAEFNPANYVVRDHMWRGNQSDFNANAQIGGPLSPGSFGGPLGSLGGGQIIGGPALRLQDLDPEGYQAFLQRQPDYQDYIKFRDTSSTDIRRHMDYSDWSRYKKFDPQHLENIMSGSSQPQQPTSAPAVPPQMINGVSVDQIASLIGRRNGTTF